MKSSILFFAALLFVGITSCSKDNDTKPTNGLTGKAKQVNDIIWGGTFANGTKSITIDDVVEYTENNGEAYTFTVDSATPYTSTQVGDTGQGVQYQDANGTFQVLAYIPDDAPNKIAIVMVVNGKTKGLITHQI